MFYVIIRKFQHVWNMSYADLFGLGLRILHRPAVAHHPANHPERRGPAAARIITSTIDFATSKA